MTEIAYGQPETIGLVDHPAIFPFDFYISPNISLGRLGSVIVLLTAALPATGIGSACAMMGHWPVTIFGGLTFGRRLLSFVQDRRSLCRLKRASLSKGHVVIERTSSAGPRSCIRVPLLGLHLERFVDQTTASSLSSCDIAINGPKSPVTYRRPKENGSEPLSSTRTMLLGSR
jgi:hypothetical protein